MRYHDGPFMKGSPSDLAGLVMVIGFFFFPFFIAGNTPVTPYLFGLFIAVEIFAISKWLYIERIRDDTSLIIFPIEDTMRAPTEPPTSALPQVMKQIAIVAAALLTTVGMYLTITSDSAILHWLILLIAAGIAGCWVVAKLRNRGAESNE